MQGWKTSAANTYHAVVESVSHNPIDLILVDADLFQDKTLPLVTLLQQQQISFCVMTSDYQKGNCDIRKIAAAEDIFIKPFSTKHLLAVLKQKIGNFPRNKFSTIHH